jgi:lipopolysaccharide export system protein LptA
LLIIGIAAFGVAFGIYARFLGWIDGLPELPDELTIRRAESEGVAPLVYNAAETKLQQAFGPDCLEVGDGYQWRLKFRAEGMVLAFGEMKTDPEGRVRLSPFSLATFKDRGQFPEINTVHADVAFLEFDRPVKSIPEISDRRIIGCQLETDPQALTNDPRRGRIFIINNRATASPDDDLVLETPGPLVYREAAQPNLPLDKARPQLETAAVVHMVDRRGGPDSTVITAQGMKVFLNVENEKPGLVKKSKSRGPAVSGVRRVILPSNVDMNLWSDSNDGFLASPTKATAPQQTPKPATERNHVRIITPGQFVYDVLPDGDLARFDRLPPSATPLPNCVRVVRPVATKPGVELNDQLECDALELRFAPKENSPPAPGKPVAKSPAATPADDRQSISWAHAWGQFIVLTSDSDKLEAHGNDLVYDAKTKATTLKGVPEMVALKDGNEIHAPELIMFQADEKQGRNAEAHGAGYFRMRDEGGSKRMVEARWRDQMTYREESGHNLLTLTGDARFDDRDNHQTLQADLLKLWLTPDSKPATSPPPPPQGNPGGEAPPPKIHPQRVEATGRVALQTPDMIGRDIEQLVLLFREAPPLPPPAAGAPQPAAPVNPLAAPTAAAPIGPVTAVPPPGPAATPAPPPKKPIEVRARALQAFIVRRGETNEVETVDCEDDVHVHQDPVPPQERPTDMRGRALNLKHTPGGNILTVTGTIDQPGEVHLPDISLIGPTVVIDQVENVAEVQGLGSMRMTSATDFDGKKLAKPTPMTVTWKQGMRFTGKQAVFRGFVQADQETTTILCQTMQVDLTKPVSLNQQRETGRTPSPDPATVDKVVCDAGPDRPQGAIITDTIRENGRLMSIRRLEQDEFAMYKEEGRLDAANHGNGRGFVRIIQLGPKDETQPGPKQGARPPAPAAPTKPLEQEYKATIVRYKGPMRLNNQSRTAQFFDDVEVLHLPVETPDRQPPFDSTVNKLPLGALYLHSNRMTVYSAKDAAGQTRQEMIANGRADVTIGDQFHGAADEIKYDEAKQLVTLVGRPGAPAHARRLGPSGTDSGEIIAEKILYDRARDIINIERGYSATGH